MPPQFSVHEPTFKWKLNWDIIRFSEVGYGRTSPSKADQCGPGIFSAESRSFADAAWRSSLSWACSGRGILLKQSSRDIHGYSRRTFKLASSTPTSIGGNHEHRKSSIGKASETAPDKQKEVLDFVETLEKNAGATRHRRSLKGLWADLGVEVSSEDIAETRREMWGGFPREDV